MKAVLTILGATLLAVVSLFLIFSMFLGSAPPPARAPATLTTPQSPGRGIGEQGASAAVELTKGRTTQEASADTDLGAGTPGAWCSTDRLGKTFELDDVTYVCAGPKPYRWRKQ